MRCDAATSGGGKDGHRIPEALQRQTCRQTTSVTVLFLLFQSTSTVPVATPPSLPLLSEPGRSSPPSSHFEHRSEPEQPSSTFPLAVAHTDVYGD